MRTIELILGSIIVVSTLVDIFQSVVVPRPTRGSLRLAPFLLDGMWPHSLSCEQRTQKHFTVW